MTTALKDQLSKLLKHSHAGFALLGAAISDQQLEDALKTKMRILSKKASAELFTGYGPPPPQI